MDVVHLSVPIGNKTEPELMAALEFVVLNHLAFNPMIEQATDEVERASNWLAIKYGTTK